MAISPALQRPPALIRVLRDLKKNVLKIGKFDLTVLKPELYLAVLKSAFVKGYEFADYVNRLTEKRIDESAFFMTAGLRGICEDIIALKFIGQFDPAIRKEIINLEIAGAVSKASEAQKNFFEKVRPFQPIVRVPSPAADLQKRKDSYKAIGIQTGLGMIKEKLPPVEQMAANVGLAEVYDFFYRITSETVHFNVRVALRNGWGPMNKIEFGTKKFCKYYAQLNQIYGVYLFTLFCDAFKTDLDLDDKFMKGIKRLSLELSRELRWPEPVTFEEMNMSTPNPILSSVLFIAHMEKHDSAFIKTLRKRAQRAKTKKQDI
jgi:hypothetical protein